VARTTPPGQRKPHPKGREQNDTENRALAGFCQQTAVRGYMATTWLLGRVAPLIKDHFPVDRARASPFSLAHLGNKYLPSSRPLRSFSPPSLFFLSSIHSFVEIHQQSRSRSLTVVIRDTNSQHSATCKIDLGFDTPKKPGISLHPSTCNFTAHGKQNIDDRNETRRRPAPLKLS